MQRQEFRHHTDEQIEACARAALALVEALDPPADLRPALLEQAMGMYAAKQIVFEQVPPTLLGAGLPRH